MTLKCLNTICYGICIVTTVLGAVFALLLIWGDVEDEMLWKGLLTIAVFFLVGAVTLSVNKMIEKKPDDHT